jgi:hypothetical protein
MFLLFRSLNMQKKYDKTLPSMDGFASTDLRADLGNRANEGLREGHRAQPLGSHQEG